jgi:glutaconate CoA-transferase subunit B
MEVLSLHPGVTLEDVQQNTGFEIGAANELTGTEPPGERELAVLREDVDPHGYVIGR